MAIKRLDPKATFKVISQYDDALETESLEELKTGEKNPDETDKLKPTRYEQYVEKDFDETLLKFKEGMQPDRFILRSLTADELADINARYVFVDTVAKKVITSNRNKMLIEMFKVAYQGIVSPEGVVSKPDLGEFPYPVQVELGSIVSLIATLSKNEKKH